MDRGVNGKLPQQKEWRNGRRGEPHPNDTANAPRGLPAPWFCPHPRCRVSLHNSIFWPMLARGRPLGFGRAAGRTPARDRVEALDSAVKRHERGTAQAATSPPSLGGPGGKKARSRESTQKDRPKHLPSKRNGAGHGWTADGWVDQRGLETAVDWPHGHGCLYTCTWVRSNGFKKCVKRSVRLNCGQISTPPKYLGT